MRPLVTCVLLSGCSFLHHADPIHDQIDIIVRTHDEKIADGYGEVTREALENDSKMHSRALVVGNPRTMGLIGREGSKLCFVHDRNVSGIQGLEAARASARKWYEGARYQFLFFRDLPEAKAKRPWPTPAATQPIEFRADAAVGVEGETYTNSHGEVRKFQDDAEVTTTFCGNAPTVPRDANWFALVLLNPKHGERNKVMLWQIKDAPAPQPASPAE